jgi:hypothetical protein
VLNVVGVQWSDRIAEKLKEYGFTEYESTNEGFITRRSVATKRCTGSA